MIAGCKMIDIIGADCERVNSYKVCLSNFRVFQVIEHVMKQLVLLAGFHSQPEIGHASHTRYCVNDTVGFAYIV